MEDFAPMHIDKPEKAAPWPHPVPRLSYWTFNINRDVMSIAQSQFYNYFKENLRQGKIVDLEGQYGYVSIFKDELLKLYCKKADTDKAEVLELAKTLIRLYNYKGHDLDIILESEVTSFRKLREREYFRGKTAQWIPIDEKVEADGHVFTRGGFYLGTYLEAAHYSKSARRFLGRSTKVEGPVVNFAPADGKLPSVGINQPSTYVELAPAMQKELLKWLEGNDEIQGSILTYWLAGIEFRLFADAKTGNEERKEIVKYLFCLLEHPVISKAAYIYSLEDRIESMIDFAVARFFLHEAIDIFPEHLIEILPATKYCLITNKIGDINKRCADDNDFADVVSREIKVPKGLPAVYHDDFREKFRQMFKLELQSRGTAWIDPAKTTYKPIFVPNIYYPSDVIREELKEVSIRMPEKTNILFNKFMSVHSRLMSGLERLIHYASIKASPLAMATALPSWLKADKLPGVKEALKEIAPADNEDYRMVPLQALMEKFGVAPGFSDYLDNESYSTLILRLYQVGLQMGCGNSIIKVRYADTVPVVRQGYEPIPARGTIAISLYLIAMLINSDGASERDFALIDQWLIDYDRKSAWAPTAQGVIRWLAARKLTFNAKRKAKAAKLEKYPKRRDELVSLLLRLVSDPEHTSPKRMKRLEAIYEVLGLNPADIHSDIHRQATEGSPKAAKKAGSASKATSAIDKSKLKAMEESTKQARQILSTVFEEKEETPPTSAKESAAKPKETKKENPMLRLAKQLAEKEQWDRREFETLAKSYGETAGSALEKLNDMSYDQLDAPIADDDGDTIYIDLDIAKSLL